MRLLGIVVVLLGSLTSVSAAAIPSTPAVAENSITADDVISVDDGHILLENVTVVSFFNTDHQLTFQVGGVDDANGVPSQKAEPVSCPALLLSRVRNHCPTNFMDLTDFPDGMKAHLASGYSGVQHPYGCRIYMVKVANSIAFGTPGKDLTKRPQKEPPTLVARHDYLREPLWDSIARLFRPLFGGDDFDYAEKPVLLSDQETDDSPVVVRRSNIHQPLLPRLVPREIQYGCGPPHGLFQKSLQIFWKVAYGINMECFELSKEDKERLRAEMARRAEELKTWAGQKAAANEPARHAEELKTWEAQLAQANAESQLNEVASAPMATDTASAAPAAPAAPDTPDTPDIPSSKSVRSLSTLHRHQPRREKWFPDYNDRRLIEPTEDNIFDWTWKYIFNDTVAPPLSWDVSYDFDLNGLTDTSRCDSRHVPEHPFRPQTLDNDANLIDLPVEEPPPPEPDKHIPKAPWMPQSPWLDGATDHIEPESPQQDYFHRPPGFELNPSVLSSLDYIDITPKIKGSGKKSPN